MLTLFRSLIVRFCTSHRTADLAAASEIKETAYTSADVRALFATFRAQVCVYYASAAEGRSSSRPAMLQLSGDAIP